MKLFKRITIDPAACTGKPCIRGLRFPVSRLLGLLASGETPETILRDYPYLEKEDIEESLKYAEQLADKENAEILDSMSNDQYIFPMKEGDLNTIFEQSSTDYNNNSIRNVRLLISRGDFYKGEEEDYFLDPTIPRPRSPFPYRMITKRGAIKLAKTSRGPGAKKFLKDIGERDDQKYYSETACLEILINSIKNITQYITQYHIDDYRIDLYLKDIELAIECDEFEHRYKKESDEEREHNIKNKLKCDFIRFNPHDVDFNIGNIINEIFKKIIEKKYRPL